MSGVAPEAGNAVESRGPIDDPDAMAADRPYPDVPSQPRFPAVEEEILAFWKREGIFQESVERRPAGERGGNEFVFYDGPPFANGLPHYGHLLTGFIKDVVPRFRTMRGRRVERRFGWDCHGLPAEMETERELGISGRKAITEYGIDKFNAHCREAVMRYTAEWEHYVTRQARWVEFESAYRTMDLDYMESVLWAVKTLHDKGLLYEGQRVMAYSWAAESPVSNFETRLDDSYRVRQDPAVTVAVRLEPTDADPGPTSVLIWTTTPWTLPSNLAVAVGPELDYDVWEHDGERWVLGAGAASKYAKELEGATKVATLKGAALVGRRYRPLFDYFADRDAFRVLAGDFVDVAEGTGAVHMAPGFGEDDHALCTQHGIEVVCPVDDRGRFTDEVPDYAGQLVFDANKPIVRALKERGVLVRHDTIEHNYPHCWRTDEPLIYRAMTSWFLDVTAIRDRMVALNQRIHWYPERIRDGQFGKWLEGARDWNLSRNRFWGTPLPIWKSDDPRYPRLDVYGSLDELERDFGVRPTDLHRPAIDALVRPNPDDPTGASTMRRIPDVLDGWFESGSMPFAQIHYPFENEQWFEDHFPADFITEYIAQTRGWFYTLVVLATALFDKPPFKSCVCHGVVVDEDGQKLSKRKRNYPSPNEVFDTHGADALRWFLVSSPILRGGDLEIDRSGSRIAEVVRLVLNPIWNAYAFFCMYANADGVRGRMRADAEGRLDRYVLAKTRELAEGVGDALEDYDLPGACAHVRAYLDALNNWYIRRSRARFWSKEHDAAKADAYDTLYTSLVVLCRVAAPLLPLVTEAVHRGLTGERSVHLCDWPDPDELPSDPALVADMDRVREVCSTALGLREEHRLRVRLPLAHLTVAGPGAERLRPFFDLVRDEVNVKAVETSEELESFGRWDLKVDARALGPRLGPKMKDVIAASKKGAWRRTDAGVEVAGEALQEGEYVLRLLPREGLGAVAIGALPGGDMLVVLDVATTPELEREGVARDVVRLVQSARKEAGLHVSDRIALWVDAGAAVRDALGPWRAYVMEQTLAVELGLGAAPDDASATKAELDGTPIAIGVRKA